MPECLAGIRAESYTFTTGLGPLQPSGWRVVAEEGRPPGENTSLSPRLHNRECCNWHQLPEWL